MKNSNRAIIEMIICAGLWSIAGIFMKKLPWNGFAMASLRSGIAGITIGAYILIKKYRIIFNKKTMLMAFFGGMTYLCFAVANKLTTAANAIVLQFTSPVFVLLYSAAFFGKKIKKFDVITVAVTLCGIALCFLDGLKSGHTAGNFVAVAAGMVMAAMFVSAGELQDEERFSGAFLAQMFTFLAGLPWVFITKPELTAVTFTNIMILGVLQLGISYILYTRAAKYCTPLACCLLGVIEPLLNPIWVMIFDGETPGPAALAGGAIVIITVTLWCALGGEKTKNESPA